MAKIQKSLMLHEDLVQVVAAHEAATGASFTRIMTAALLQYLFDTPQPDSRWMQITLALERGDVDVGNLPLELAKARIFENTRTIKSMRLDEVTRPDGLEGHAERVYAELAEAERTKEFWTTTIANSSSPIEAVLWYFRHQVSPRVKDIHDELRRRDEIRGRTTPREDD